MWDNLRSITHTCGIPNLTHRAQQLYKETASFSSTHVHSVTTITVYFQPSNISTHTQAPRTTFTLSHPAPPRTPKHSTRSPISCTGSTTDHHQHCQAHSYPAKPTHTLPCTLIPTHGIRAFEFLSKHRKLFPFVPARIPHPNTNSSS